MARSFVRVSFCPSAISIQLGCFLFSADGEFASWDSDWKKNSVFSTSTTSSLARKCFSGAGPEDLRWSKSLVLLLDLLVPLEP
ncbi:hypothetical protein ABKV19_008441, partial [Rosa sericea]